VPNLNTETSHEDRCDHRGPASDTVTIGGKYVGQDPDAAIRFELKRDYSVHAGGGE
jgi:hypothetical protein